MGIPQDEASLYLTILVAGKWSTHGAQERGLAESLRSRGLLIVESKGRSYLPVHPRMAMSNLFRTYEEGLFRIRREKRLLVDKLTTELIPIAADQSKGTKASSPRGAKGG